MERSIHGSLDTHPPRFNGPCFVSYYFETNTLPSRAPPTAAYPKLTQILSSRAHRTRQPSAVNWATGTDEETNWRVLCPLALVSGSTAILRESARYLCPKEDAGSISQVPSSSSGSLICPSKNRFRPQLGLYMSGAVSFCHV